MISVDVSVVNSQIKAILRQTKEMQALLVGEETMLAVAAEGVTIVKERTGKGVDAEGASFKSYTDEYAKLRAKKKRSTTPNLWWSGRMMNNIKAKYLGIGRAVILFTSTEQANKAAGNMKKRNFFDISSPPEIARLIGVLTDKVKKITERIK